MQLTCPTCGARYQIDAREWPADPGPDGGPLFRPRRVRCKVCRTVWAALPEEEVLELDDPLPPDDDHPRAGAESWPAVIPVPDIPVSDAKPAPLADAPAPPPPPRPAIHFEAPPVPLQPAERPGGRPRLPGPAAYAQAAGGTVAAEPVALAAGPPDKGPGKVMDTPPAPLPRAAPDVAADSEDDTDDDQPDGRPRRLLLWFLGLVLLAGLVWWALVASGRVRPEHYGLPPYDPAQIGFPALVVPSVQLPRAAPPPLGVEAEAIRRALPGGRQVWEIAGIIRNPTNRRHAVPPVELLLLDAGGAIVGRWTVQPEARSVDPGASIRFESSAIDPPAGAVRLRMQLKPAELGRL